MDEFMAEAVRLARQARPHPNPRVGAVVVRDGRVIGRGYHVGPGTDHAEIVALGDASELVAGATMYVTLEPCAHHGRTPPCAPALVEAGIARVVVGELDPDSRVAGKGIGILEAAGITVEMLPPGESVDPAYHHHRRTGLPLVRLKTAMTLDGQIAAADGTSQWITGPEARRLAHEMRAEADAVVIGAGTLRKDNPRLTVRLEGYDGPQPRPVIIAGTGPLPADAAIWKREPLVVVPSGEAIAPPAGVVVEVAARGGRVDLVAAMRAVAEHGNLDVLVESGGTLASGLWDAGLIHRGAFFYGARVAGGHGMGPFGGRFATLSDAREVTVTSLRAVGPDVLVEFEVPANGSGSTSHDST